MTDALPPYQPVRSHWRPSRRYVWLLALLVSTALLISYSHVSPHYDSLPNLPKVQVQINPRPPPAGSEVAALSEVDSQKTQQVFLPDCICGSTSRGRALCDVYTEHALRASRLVEGSGARIRNLLARLHEGIPLTVGVLGGSVSACRGVHPNPEHPEGDPVGPGCYHQVLNEWLKETFPNSEITTVNSAIGGIDSSYFAFCGTHHLAKNADLIILEFDVNDQADTMYMHFFDQLIRVLLQLPQQPALIILGAWAPRVAQDQGWGDPQVFHVPIANYFDVPYLSLKRVIFDHYTRFPRSTADTFFLKDRLHPNARGQRLLADILIGYLESQLCELSRHGLPPVPDAGLTIASERGFGDFIELDPDVQTPGSVDWSAPPKGWEKTFDQKTLDRIGEEKRHFVLPTSPYAVRSLGMFTPLELFVDPDQPDPPTADHILNALQPRPFCADANDRQHPMKPRVADGWKAWDWHGAKHYWISNTPGSRITVDIQVNAGRVAIYYFRSAQYSLGDALCWVDDNEAGKVRLPGYWSRAYNMAVVKYIDQRVSKGRHYVTCEIASNSSHPTEPDASHFRLVAVMAT